MKKFLLTTLLALGLLAPNAEAITVDDLDGKLCGQIFIDNKATANKSSSENPLIHMNRMGVFEKKDNNTVIVHNFYGEYDAEFRLMNNKLILNYGASGLVAYPGYYNGSRAQLIFTAASLDYRFTVSNQYRYCYNTMTPPALTSDEYQTLGLSNDNTTGVFNFGSRVLVQDTGMDGQTAYDMWVLEGFKLIVIDPNRTALDSEGNTYKVNVIETSNNVYFQNLLDLGPNYTNSYTSNPTYTIDYRYTAQYTNSNKDQISFKSMVIGGYRDVTWYGYSYVTYGGYAYYGYYTGTGNVNDYSNILSANGSSSASSGTAITADVYNTEINHYSLSDHNSHWVNTNNSSGSPVITLKGLVYVFGPMKVYEQVVRRVTDSANRTLIFNNDAEYTHSVSINKTEYGYGKISDKDDGQYIYLNCNLTGFKNSDYVKDYELYIVPQVTNPNYTSSDFSHEDGHVNGTRIDLLEYAHTFTPSDSDRNVRALATDEGKEENPFEGYKYNLLIPEDDLKVKDLSGNGKYQLYVKTIYTDESGLEPTFHALTSLGNTTTGVEDIIDNGELNDEDAPVMYYNMNGVLMDGNNLTPGLYIRRQGSSTSKVIIR